MQTFVYDTNVGDIAPLSTYFNPERWTEHDLNHKFGTACAESDLNLGSAASPTLLNNTAPLTSVTNALEENPLLCSKVKSASIQPRLLLIPEGAQDGTDGPREAQAAGAAGDAEAVAGAGVGTWQRKRPSSRNLFLPPSSSDQAPDRKRPPAPHQAASGRRHNNGLQSLMSGANTGQTGFKGRRLPFKPYQGPDVSADTIPGLQDLVVGGQTVRWTTSGGADDQEDEASKKLVRYLKEFPKLSSSAESEPLSTKATKVRPEPSWAEVAPKKQRFEPFLRANSVGSASAPARAASAGRGQTRTTFKVGLPGGAEAKNSTDLLHGLRRETSARSPPRADEDAGVKGEAALKGQGPDDRSGLDEVGVAPDPSSSEENAAPDWEVGTAGPSDHDLYRSTSSSSGFLAFRPLGDPKKAPGQRSSSSPDFLEWRDADNGHQDEVKVMASPSPIGPPSKGTSKFVRVPAGVGPDRGSPPGSAFDSGDWTSSRMSLMTISPMDPDDLGSSRSLRRVPASKVSPWARSSTRMLPPTPTMLDLGAPFSSVFEPAATTTRSTPSGPTEEVTSKSKPRPSPTTAASPSLTLSSSSSSLLARRGFPCPSLKSTTGAVWGSTASSSMTSSLSPFDLGGPDPASTWTSLQYLDVPSSHQTRHPPPLSAPVPGSKQWTARDHDNFEGFRRSAGSESISADIFRFPSSSALGDDDDFEYNGVDVDPDQVLVSSLRKIVQIAPGDLASGSDRFSQSFLV